MSKGVMLSALDGSNPLAFLAAIGTMRLLHLGDLEAGLQMQWQRSQGAWRPILFGVDQNKYKLCELLVEAPPVPIEELEAVGKNITVPKDKFKLFVKKAHSDARRHDRRSADFAASFGSEVCDDPDKGRIEYTNLCFITGSGHQDFLGTIVNLAKKVTTEQIYDSLFGTWKMEKGLSMRWDPSDAAEYALQWDDPGPKGAWAVWGANRLATEALPCFPVMPENDDLNTTGFAKRKRQDEFSWPIWNQAAGFDTVRSLLSYKNLQEETPKLDSLRAMGIQEVFRSQRVRIGQGANFKVSFRPARAV